MVYKMEIMGAETSVITALINMNRKTCGLTTTAPPCTEVIDRFCKEGITDQQLGRSYSDSIQTLKVYYQAYQETLADNKAKLPELQVQLPEPEKWADWITTEEEGIEDVILTYIERADHKSILPHSVRTLAANLWEVVNEGRLR